MCKVSPFCLYVHQTYSMCHKLLRVYLAHWKLLLKGCCVWCTQAARENLSLTKTKKLIKLSLYAHFQAIHYRSILSLTSLSLTHFLHALITDLS